MTDPTCDPAKIHYFRQPVYDGEKCLCQQTTYSSSTEYHHKPDESDDYKPFNPLTDIITSPWAPLIESVLMTGSSSSGGGFGFGGGQSGGGGSSGGF